MNQCPCGVFLGGDVTKQLCSKCEAVMEIRSLPTAEVPPSVYFEKMRRFDDWRKALRGSQ